MNRTTIINRFIELYGYKSYLEIGAYDGKNFDAIKCENKISVDPDPKAKASVYLTSDQFFEMNQSKFDIIFIDGLHYYEQVIKDIANALNCLKDDNGIIIVHDCNPTTKEMQEVPRSQGIWTGDVWRAWLHYRKRADLNMCVLDTDYGVGLIRKNKFAIPNNRVMVDISKITYEEFNYDKENLLNLVNIKPEPVSICIPAFEQYGWGASTLRNLFNSMLNLTGEYEIIISDNADDKTIQRVCKGFETKLPINYFKHNKRGASENINNAMSKAKHNIIKPMFQDDLFLSDDTISAISFIFKNPAISWVACSGHSINARGRLGKYRVPVYTDKIINETNTIGMPSVIAHRKIDIIYDVNLKTRLDTDFYYQLGQRHGEPEVIKKPLIGSRYWQQSTSAKQPNNTANELPYIYKKYNITKWL